MHIDSVLAQGFGSFWQLIANSGPIALLVLLILVFFSVLSWAIIVKKWRFYGQVESESQDFYEVFKKKASLSEIYQECERYTMSPLAGMYKTGYQELHRQLSASKQGEKEHPSTATALRSLDSLQRALDKSAQNEMTVLERSLDWLATTGSVTPFIGLFGTVIGIINAFQGLGQGSATTIQAVAPGISEALVATAAGLFAAIPAVIFYNHFIQRLKVFGAEMDDFSAEVLNTVESSLL
ncbi:MAG TPA: MotA/TolQ/ExbB proton channel family protein [Acidobacteriota bacterium]|nr:MotA/TolQ/ExbB proton channel family protein [Acidobacteriota bacterium]